MPKASEMTVDKNISILMKSSPGFGKTIAASSWCVEGPIHISYFDKKKPVELDHFYRHVIKRPELLDNINYDIYSAQNAHEYLNHLIKLSKSCMYVACITDSITNLTSAAVNWSIGFRDPAGAKKDELNKNASQLIPGFDEYKVETSLVTQSLDICKTLPTTIIWTAHPLSQLKIEGTGKSMRVSKANSIVTYGSKVADIVPGNFTEIYHFVKDSGWDEKAGKTTTNYKVMTESIGDDFAKTAIGLPREFDITNRLFYEVWKELLNHEAR